MTLPSTNASNFQAKTAFACTALFSLASISTNAVYGWSKGTSFPSSVVWALLAIAVGATLVLSTAALFKALAAKTYAQAAFIALGLLICGSYSVVAAVGSATGQRMSAALSEDNTASRRANSQKAIEEATAYLAALSTKRSSGVIQAEIDGILMGPGLDGCKAINGPRTKETCPHVAELRTELATAQATEKDRAETQATIDKAHSELVSLPPPKVVNSDAVAVAQLLQAFGYNPTVAEINTALAILSVLVIELGGSVSLAVGLALSGEEKDSDKSSESTLSRKEEQALSPQTALPSAEPSKDGQQKGPQALATKAFIRSTISVRDRLLADVKSNKGGLRSTYETLAAQYGVSGARIGQIIRELKQDGALRVRKTKSGTILFPVLGLAAVS